MCTRVYILGVELTGNENTILTYGSDGTQEKEHGCGEPAQWEFKVGNLLFRSPCTIPGKLNHFSP